jgi:hypothetical protein
MRYRSNLLLEAKDGSTMVVITCIILRLILLAILGIGRRALARGLSSHPPPNSWATRIMHCGVQQLNSANEPTKPGYLLCDNNNHDNVNINITKNERI